MGEKYLGCFSGKCRDLRGNLGFVGVTGNLKAVGAGACMYSTLDFGEISNW